MKKIDPKIIRNSNIWIALATLSFLLAAFMLIYKSVDTRGLSHQYLIEKNDPVKISEWEFRWDDIAPPDLNQNFPVKEGWKPVIDPIAVPERNGRNILWLKCTIPQNNYPNPTIFCRLIFEVFDIYLDGKKIYSFGFPDRGEQSEFAGWPWHIIPVPPGSGGRELFFRIKSNHAKIGIFGGGLLAPPNIHIMRILHGQIDSFVLSFIFFFMGVFLILLFFRDRENQYKLGYFSLGGSAVLMGIFTLSKAGSDIKQLFIDSPVMWSYLELASLYFLPVGFVSYIERFFTKVRILSVLWKVHFASAFISLILIFIGIIPLSKTIPPNQILLLISTCTVIVIIFIYAFKGNSEAKFFAFSVFILGITIIIDVLSAMGIISIQRSISHWGIFIVLVSLSMLLGVRYRKLNQQIEESYLDLEKKNIELAGYKDHLEQIVDERTLKLNDSLEELSHLNKELEALSRTDPLTGLMNRRHFNLRLDEEFKRMKREVSPISFLMIDIDFFKKYNDFFGHQAGDETLRQVASVLTQCACRSTDIISRYGGEEFAIVLPGTDLNGSILIAEEIRAAIISADIKMPDGSLYPCVTVSIGAAMVVPYMDATADDLISKSDLSLYRAKSDGRNIVRSET